MKIIICENTMTTIDTIEEINVAETFFQMQMEHKTMVFIAAIMQLQLKFYKVDAQFTNG